MGLPSHGEEVDFKSTGKSLRYFNGGCCGKDELQRGNSGIRQMEARPKGGTVETVSTQWM